MKLGALMKSLGILNYKYLLDIFISALMTFLIVFKL
jgi:hypothetical protein